MDVLQQELYQTVVNWNLYYIRLQKCESPAGRPDVLYHLPELKGTHDYEIEVSENDPELAEESFYHKA